MLIHLICLGKLKDISLEAIENDYLKRLTSLKLKIIELKAQAQNPEKEGMDVWDKIQNLNLKSPYIVLLDEKGSQMPSVDFSKWIFDKMSQAKQLVFVLGGAEGHAEFIRNKAQEKLSLSKLTFPHKLARIIMVEQIYRAMTIEQGHPYHN